MSASSTQSGEDSDDSQAIRRVLEAERAADLAVKECERQAEQILHTARNRAQRIALRTDTRISHMHMRCEQRLAEQYRHLAGAAAGAQNVEDATTVDSAALQKVVDRLAASLSSTDKAGS